MVVAPLSCSPEARDDRGEPENYRHGVLAQPLPEIHRRSVAEDCDRRIPTREIFFDIAHTAGRPRVSQRGQRRTASSKSAVLEGGPHEEQHFVARRRDGAGAGSDRRQLASRRPRGLGVKSPLRTFSSRPAAGGR
jgi:hypothetical protein